ncbi:hypothetical protein ACHAXS_007586 [Conticribra weissflogii]
MTSSTTMAASSSSSSPTKPPDPSSTHRLSAAADLIRNLDAALSSMNHAASAAARDAAKARRNAKAAGEVARRYGGSGGPSSPLRINTNINGGGSFGKRKSPRGTPKAASAMTKDERLKDAEQRALERKWERRTAARLAAEARQRRESPRKGEPGGSGNVMAGFRAAVKETVERSHEYYGYISPDKSTRADASGAAADTDFRTNHSQLPPQVSNEGSDDRTADGTTAFEDALDHIHGEDCNTNEQLRHEDQQQHYDQGQQNWQQYTEGQVTQDDYYNQQRQYYGQLQGQQQYYNLNNGQQDYYNQMQHDQTQYEQAWESSAQQQQNQPQKQQQSQTQPPTSATITANGRIAASNAEDVLALSLELERTRSQLAQTTSTLESTKAELVSLQSSYSHLQSEHDRLSKELSTVEESTTSQIHDLTQKYQQEMVRAKAAEEDAALALDLAKEAQAAKEEVETWLGRGLEEIDAWKRRARELEGLLQQQGSFSGGDGGEGYHEESTEGGFTSPDQKKFVRFADQTDTPISPLVHAKNDETESHFQNSVPPPTTPTSHSSNAPSPTSASVNTSTQTSVGTSNGNNSTPSKSAIASGRVWLHRNSPLLSPPGSSTSSLLSPDPKLKAAELLKRSAETTKLLREKLRHGNGVQKPTPPPSLALIAATAANAKHGGGILGEGSALAMLNDNSFATRQGAACRAVGKTIRESGQRLELEGKWWNRTRKALADDDTGTEMQEPILFHGVAELESMVKDYCGTVEGTIGKQKEKIEELVAFCDLLEKEVVNVRVNQENGGDGIGSATAVGGTF